LDACTLINLINGKVLQKIMQVPSVRIYIGKNLLDQEILDEIQSNFVTTLIYCGQIQIVDSAVTIDEYFRLKEEYDLGDGETETIALSKQFDCYFASDDKKARKCAAIELGEGKVIGSLQLLKISVNEKVLSINEAWDAFELMKKKGAFLPDINTDYLRGGV